MENKIQSVAKWLGSGSLDILGRPFAGKDTQAKRLAELLGGQVISSGEIFRNYHDQKKLQEIMSTGALVPTPMFLDIMIPFFQQLSGDEPLILSSVGKMHGEEESIVQATEKSGHPLKAVVECSLSEDEVWKRFEAARELHDRGDRADDKKAVIEKRLEVYKQKTLPVLEFYREKKILIEVNGNQSREKVTEDIVSALAHRAQQDSS